MKKRLLWVVVVTCEFVEEIILCADDWESDEITWLLFIMLTFTLEYKSNISLNTRAVQLQVIPIITLYCWWNCTAILPDHITVTKCTKQTNWNMVWNKKSQLKKKGICLALLLKWTTIITSKFTYSQLACMQVCVVRNQCSSSCGKSFNKLILASSVRLSWQLPS